MITCRLCLRGLKLGTNLAVRCPNEVSELLRLPQFSERKREGERNADMTDNASATDGVKGSVQANIVQQQCNSTPAQEHPTTTSHAMFFI